MISIIDKYQCCGCEGCVQVCPKQCISFGEDSEGFRYPVVDEAICINCGLCEKVCPVQNQAEKRTPLKVYAAKNQNEEELLASSSGGLFIFFAKKIIAEGGVVFGAKFDSRWEVVHSYADDLEGVYELMRSKYAQSRMGTSYLDAKEFLKDGKTVLFVGTSCQIAGLKRFLGKEYENLITMDVVCHGVPSPKIWRRYLEELKQDVATKKNKQVEIRNISFRDKQSGWKKFSIVFTFAFPSGDGNDKTISISRMHREDAFMKLFLTDLILRPSCYQCPARGGKSQSDLTIADFWGIENIIPEYYDERGVGLLMVNSPKGLKMLDDDILSVKEVSLDDATKRNPCYFSSKLEPKNRAECFRRLDANGARIDGVAQIMFHVSFFTRLKSKFKVIIKDFI